MKEIILTVVVGLLLTIAGLFIEKCYFEKDSCPIESSTTQVKVSDPTIVNNSNKKKTAASFRINYIYRDAGQGEAKFFSKTNLLKGNTLKTGDTYKIIFQPPAKKHVYIFRVDSANKISKLFPTTDFADSDKKNVNPVKKGKKYFVPARNWSFKLEGDTGKETIYTVVSDKPDKILEQQYATMLAQQDNDTNKQRRITRKEWHKAMKKRGVKNKLLPEDSISIKWKEGKQKLSANLLKLQNICDGCVNIVHFKHK